MENLFPNHFVNHEIITSPASPDFLDDFEIVPTNYGKNQENLFKLGHSIVNTLQSWSDPGLVILAFSNIKKHFHHDDFQDFLVAKKIDKVVMKAMEILPDDIAVQVLGCQLLDLFFEKNEDLQMSLISLETHRHIVKVLHENKTDLVLQVSALNLLEKLMGKEEVLDQVMLDEYNVNIANEVFTCLHTHHDNHEIKRSAYSILKLLLEEDDDVKEICIKRENLQTMLDNFSASQENCSDILLKILQIFACFTLKGRNEDNERNFRQCLVDNDIHYLIMRQLQQSNDEDVVEECLKYLVQLTKEDADKKFLFESGYLKNNLIQTMGKWSDNAGLQIAGLKLFILSAPDKMSGILSIDEFVTRWCKTVYEAMSRHLEDPSVQAYGCRAVATMIENRHDSVIWIGENSQEKISQEPIHTMCMGALLMHRKDPKVFVAACNTIYWLAADNERLCSNLMDKNVHTVVMDGLKLHINYPKATEAGLKALRGLCIFNDKNKRRLVADERIFNMISKILDKFPQQLSIQLEATSTLACIADIDSVRYQCFLEDIHIKVIQSLERFVDNETIQEVGIECLSVLCAAENASEMLNMAGATQHVITVLKKYLDMVYLQKKGLILIQLLADKKMCRDREICSGLADTLYKSLVTHSDNNGVLKEACVALQILAETGKEISDSLVEKGCHQILFNLLESDEDAEIKDLICECLYVMGLTPDLKSKMLCNCTKGVLVGAECLLELGADVNYTDGETTPLCHAVINQDEDLVRLFLKHDISNLHKPLKLSLEVEQDTIVANVITGHILGCIGDRSGKQALWNNLGLETLKADWLTVAFAKLIRNDSDLSKHLAYRIKNSHDRKNHRLLAYTKSDSDMMKTFGRHKFFRYKIKSGSSVILKENESESPDKGIVKTEPIIMKIARSNSDSMLKLKGKQLPAFNQLSPIMSPRTSREWLDRNVTEEFEINENPNEVVFPVFESSEQEADEWKCTTLTGANVPYNPADPRHKGSTEKLYFPEKISVPWSRKSRSPSPRTGMSRNNSYEQLDLIGVDSKLPYQPLVRNENDLNDNSLVRRINECLDGSRNSSIDSLFSDNESRRSSVVLNNNIEVVLLDVSSNKISDIQNLSDCDREFWAKFTCLQKISMSYNKLQTLPEELFKNLPTLKQFEAKSNKITKIPMSLLESNSLKHLDLSDNKIHEIGLGDEMWRNENLKFLDLSSNIITEIPKLFCQRVPALTHFFLNCNEIRELPKEPLELPGLKVLELSCNYIKSVPEEFLHGSSKLEILDLENNEIESLPKQGITSMLPKLIRLKLKKNKLTEKEPLYIPKFILDLQNLRKLDLSDNNIVSFPSPSQWRSQFIQEIKLSRNKITKLNLEGGKSWTKLETLAIDGNNLSELPKEIGQLSSLTSLDISFNKSLKTLPDEMGRCSRMWEFRYRGVELQLDRSLVNGRVKDLISFLHNKLKKAAAYFRMKVMVVGYGGRGKSTLLRALMKMPKPAANNTPTVGIIVKDWAFERYRKDIGKKVLYTLSTWDFAGQEEFYSTHQCYLSNKALYLVVLRINKGLAELELLKPWLSNIYARAPGCPVIVVGTHFDKVHRSQRGNVEKQFIDRLNDLKTKPGFPDIQAFCPVDCSLEKDNVDLEKLREKIKDVIDNYKVKGQPVMGQMVPASYVKLSDKLAEEAKILLKKSYPIISHNQLLKIVKQSSIDLDEEELIQAIRFLHEFGILLHYEDASLQLKDLHFIDPGWLCRMMAQVITVRQINPFIKNGILRKTDTKILFTGKKVDKDQPFIYPPELIPQYLKLLEKFEIALPHSDTELMIPCYLPDKKPVLHLPALQKHEKICRYYIMPYVQLGLWPRLITRLITFSTSFLTKLSRSKMKLLLEVDKQPAINYWKKGVCSIWSENAFYLVEFHSNEKEEIQVTVPNTSNGAGLLGLLVDHLDALIEEWYPGLTTVDPYLGRELLEKLVPCVDCTGQNMKLFRLDDLLHKTENEGTSVYCDVHNGMVKIAALAPELVLMDLNPDLIMDNSQFDFVECEEKKLGDGGYGAVYRATYKSQPVAVKVFAAIGDVHPLKMLRQEATVLRCLKHPSVVSLLAVGISPHVVVLELAQHLSLGTVLKQEGKLQQIMQHKIALQVAEGLSYLHQMMIVYRDMKPDNVLIFSKDPKSLINAKISDYGISRFSMLDGLMLQEGTLAYRAPEVIRGETYSFKADVFSYGITLYSLLTNGKHPFSEFECKGEMDKAIAEGQSVHPITEKDVPPWPGMQALLLDCLHPGPDQRPESSAICDKLRDPEVLNLKQRVPVTKGLSVECLTVQKLDEGKVCLWAASGNSECVQLSRLDLQLQTLMETKGAIFTHGRILCLLALKENCLLIGTEECRIWIYNTLTLECTRSTTLLTDAVLCMRHIPGSKDDLVFVGLANGTIAVFLVSDLIHEEKAIPMCLTPGNAKEVVRCMEVSQRDKRLYVSCGSRVLILRTRSSIGVEKKIDTADPKRPSQINNMVLGHKKLFLSHAKSCIVHIYIAADLKPRSTLDISQIFQLRKDLSRVTSLALQGNIGVLWIGTGSGHIGLVDVKTQNLIVLTHRYTNPVRSLLTVHHKEYPLIVSGALGFHDRADSYKCHDEDYGNIIVWDGNFSRNVRQQMLEIKQRQQLVENYLTL
ncbi:leucine-rich repeat serine/threonine-protein kinase 2-like isoform X1 [Mytilus galloprovincialis]|uniref:leucine-rich repeat serine/threonine-protein kinase 2-like isoform X1 n=2 Tax=Mytilus galloprovincialis TaxID=29158 RepID=UPI003F7BBC1F